MNALEARGVSRKFGKREVLKDLSLTIEAGRFEALMGPSGSGKSTFLHLAAGLLGADAGEILVGGSDIVKMSDSAATKFRRRHIGVVFQNFNLLNDRTLKDNVMMPRLLDGEGRTAELQRRAEVLLHQLGFLGREFDKPEQLSGGEQQRIAIARAVIAEPDIVLADEPTGNLDTNSAKEVCEILKRANERDGRAILVVTHDPVVAACASKVHFLKDGRIAASHETNGDPALVSKLYLETYK